MMRRLAVLVLIALAAVLALASCRPRAKHPPTAGPTPKPPAEAMHNVRLWFPDATATVYVPVVRAVKSAAPKTIDQQVSEAVKLLIAGPKDEKNLSRSFPKDTEVRRVAVKDGAAAVDFNDKLTSYGGGHTYEQFLYGTLVLTVAEIPGITTLTITVGGKPLATLPEGTEVAKPIDVKRVARRLLAQYAGETENVKKGASVTYWMILESGYLVPITVPTSLAGGLSEEFARTYRNINTFGGLYRDCFIKHSFSAAVTPDAPVKPDARADSVTISFPKEITSLDQVDQVKMLECIILSLPAKSYRVLFEGKPVTSFNGVAIDKGSYDRILATTNVEI
jgi:hypothetical protein